MRVRFSFTNTIADGVELIQLLEFKETHGGKSNYEIDGGLGSTDAETTGSPVNTNAPYYVGYFSDTGRMPNDLEGTWQGDRGNMVFNDYPFHIEKLSKMKFRVVIVAVNFMGSGADVSLGYFEWGFINENKKYYPIHKADKLSQDDLKNTSSAVYRADKSFWKNLFKFYPSYQIIGIPKR
jgi:hypothetical protein